MVSLLAWGQSKDKIAMKIVDLYNDDNNAARVSLLQLLNRDRIVCNCIIIKFNHEITLTVTSFRKYCFISYNNNNNFLSIAVKHLLESSW